MIRKLTHRRRKKENTKNKETIVGSYEAMV